MHDRESTVHIAPPAPQPAARGRSFTLMQALSVLTMGLGIGWLVGLSLSPVVGSVIASLLGIVGGVVVGLRSVPGYGTGGIDARPAALLVLGIAVAATAGLLARTHGLLAPPPTTAAAGMQAQGGQPAQAGLFSMSLEECAELRGAWGRGQPAQFVRQFEASIVPQAKELAARIPDPETLALIVEALCTPR
ncbi:MAG TPA: hypothetical protein VFR86_29405 [Burkholderiaceae bacterium]|nr:hypothetical protein [Burkholderiaceae bacterium]